MNLQGRPITPQDFPRCHELLLAQEGYSYTEPVRSNLPAIWQALIKQSALIMGVVEDLDRAPSERLVGWGAIAFVRDDWMCEVQKQAIPLLNCRTLARFDQPDSPFLNLEGVRTANSSTGLSVLFLHVVEWQPARPDVESTMLLREALMKLLFAHLCGYRVRAILQEFFGPDDGPFMETIGLRLRSDYSEFYATHPLPPPDERPLLWGLTRAEALNNWGCSLASLFIYSEPRFGFQPGEQKLLEVALMGATEQEIASLLSYSEPAIRKKWNAIYDKVSRCDVGVLPSNEGQNQKRGTEKRRRLLEYLRHHPEELRPYNAQR